MSFSSVSIAMTGSGGAGVMTAGQILIDAAARAGWYGLMGRSLGPQIRGGESAALLRLSPQPVQSPDDYYDLLIAVDWGNIERFASELPLHAETVVLCDPSQGDVPAFIRESNPRIVEIPLKDLAKSSAGGRVNMVALGAVAAAVGVPLEAIESLLRSQLAKKGEEVIQASLTSVQVGIEAARALPDLMTGVKPLAAPHNGESLERWSISGNEGTGLGALRGGVRFCAAYPITPATEVLEWLAPNLAHVGGTLVQAEDELASINMCLGGSFGGVPSLTATSGPGLALMTEGLGLAVASETPVVVVDVMRGGPSTGIPTKSEQSDLNIAVYGLHGDAPHIVTAPLSISDCVFTAQWSVYLAESRQCPVIMLSDQAAGQSRAVINRPEDAPFVGARLRAEPDEAEYNRYALTEDGVSPMAVPGTAGRMYTADGLEHSPKGTPSTQGRHHQEQLDKRLRKLTDFDYGDAWAEISGPAEATVAVVTFGSITEQVREALARAAEAGLAARLIAVRLLAPARPQQMAAALAGVEKLLVVEQNHSAQFHALLRSTYDLPPVVQTLHRAGPLALRPHEIVTALQSLAKTSAAASAA